MITTRKDEHTLLSINKTRVQSLALFVFLLAIGIIYASTLAVNHSEAEDSLNYLVITRDGSVIDLFHPHHLLFHIFNRGIYLLWGLVGFNGSPEVPMEMNNVVAGLAGLGLIYAIARRIGMSFQLSLASMVAVASSYSYWWYSVEAETYLLPIPFILLSAYQFIALVESQFEGKRFSGLGITLAMATLFHQQHVLLVLLMPISIFIMWLQLRRDIAFLTVVRDVAIMLGVSSVIIVVPYLLVATIVHGNLDLSSIIDWTRSYQKIGMYTPWALSSPIKAIVGMGRSIWGLNPIYKFSWFQDFFTQAFPLKLLIEEQFLASHMAIYQVWISLVSFGISVLMAIGLITRKILHSSKSSQATHPSNMKAAFIAFAVPLFIVYSVFNTLWEPQNIEFWIAPLPFLVLALAAWIVRSQWDLSGRVLTWIFVASLAIGNLVGSVLPQTSHDGDFWYQANRYLIDNTRPGDQVIVDGGYLPMSYLKFYSNATVIPAAGVNPGVLLLKIQEYKSGRMLISSRVFDPLPQIKYQLEHAVGVLPEKNLLTELADRLQVVSTNFYQTIWIYQSK